MRFLFVLFYFMVLRIVTFNARGLLNGFKFVKVKELCKNDDVILLQETNWRGNVMEDFKRRWEKNGRRSGYFDKKRAGYYGKTNV